MFLTEQEAKDKWCPFTYGVQEIRGSDGQGFREPGPWTCTASACMAWRWSPINIDRIEFYEMGQKPEGDGWVCVLPDYQRERFTIKSRWERNKEQTGSCGLCDKASAQ